MITIQIVGNLGAHAEYVAGTGGRSGRYNFSLAAPTGYGENAKTMWFSCTRWGKENATLLAALSKGAKVAVVGRLSTYQTKDDETRMGVDVLELELVGSKPAADKSGAARKPGFKADSSEPAFDDEVPF